MKTLPLFERGSFFFARFPGDLLRASWLGYNESPHVRVRFGYFNRTVSPWHFQRGQMLRADDGMSGHGWQLRVWRFAVCVFFPEFPVL